MFAWKVGISLIYHYVSILSLNLWLDHLLQLNVNFNCTFTKMNSEIFSDRSSERSLCLFAPGQTMQ